MLRKAEGTAQILKNILIISWLIGAVLVAVYPSTSFSQTSDSSVEVIDEIHVTGTRLQRSPADSPTPIAVVDRALLDAEGATNVADVLKEMTVFGMPAATPLSTSSSGTTDVGLNLLNLRSLGPSRTLVLVNGRRHVPGQAGTSAVDINAIPADFVERIEVITGGASSVYGSEAIAGVVNIITKKDMNGLIINAQTGASAEGDGETEHLSVTYGVDFADNRGNLLVNTTYSSNDRIWSIDRPNSSDDRRTNGDGSVRSPARSGVAAAGTVIYPNNSGGTTVATQGPDGLYTQPLTQDARYNRQEERTLLLPLTRYQAAANLNFDFSNDLTYFVESVFTNTKGDGSSGPTAVGDFLPFGVTGDYQDRLLMPVTNPFVPAEILATIDPTVTRFTAYTRPIHFGGRRHLTDRDSFRIATGFNGQFGDGWDWETYYQYGNTENHATIPNVFHLGRYAESIDAFIGPDGEPRCASEIARANGCEPYNIFGVNVATDAASDYVRGKGVYDTSISQSVLAATMSGSPISIGAGDILLVGGLEYREERSVLDVDRDTAAGMLSAPQMLRTAGDYSVTEVFAEIGIPLLADVGILRNANLDAAVRFADYSTIGDSVSWKVGLNVDTTANIRFRSAISEATRAPNISELFLPVVTSAFPLSDPCDGGGDIGGLDPDAAARRISNCTSLGIDSSFVADQLALESLFGQSGGNLDLFEETAQTFTAGIVITPDAAPAFQASIDYWTIDIEDAIGTIGRQTITDQCVDQPSTNNQFCPAVFRDGTTLQIRRVDSFIQNLAEQKVSGVDLQGTYDITTSAMSSLNLALTATYLLEDELRQYPNSDKVDRIGDVGHPELKVNGRITFMRGPLRASLSARYIDAAHKFRGVDTPENKIDSLWYSDANVSYGLSDHWRAYFGVNNLFDTDPPLIANPVVGTDESANTATGIYDPIGRSLYIGLRGEY